MFPAVRIAPNGRIFSASLPPKLLNRSAKITAEGKSDDLLKVARALAKLTGATDIDSVLSMRHSIYTGANTTVDPRLAVAALVFNDSATQLALIDLLSALIATALPTPTAQELIAAYVASRAPTNPSPAASDVKSSSAAPTQSPSLQPSAPIFSLTTPQIAQKSASIDVGIPTSSITDCNEPAEPKPQSAPNQVTMSISPSIPPNPTLSTLQIVQETPNPNLGIPRLLVANYNEPTEPEVQFPADSATEAELTSLLQSTYTESGLIDITTLCRMYGGGSKPLWDWRRNDRSGRYLTAVAEYLHRSEDELFMTQRGQHSGGTWAHPLVVIDILCWMDPAFAVKAYELVLRMYKGDLSLVSDVLQRHDALHGTSTNLVSIAPGRANQTRQTVAESTALAAMSAELKALQSRLNDALAEVARPRPRPLNLSGPPMPKQALMKFERGVGHLDPVAIAANGQIERALQAIQPDMVASRHPRNTDDLIQILWTALANSLNSNDNLLRQLDAATSRDEVGEDYKALTDANEQLRIRLRGLAIFETARRHRNNASNPTQHTLARLVAEEPLNAKLLHEVNEGYDASLDRPYRARAEFASMASVLSDIVSMLRASAEHGDADYLAPPPCLFQQYELNSPLPDELPSAWRRIFDAADQYDATEATFANIPDESPEPETDDGAPAPPSHSFPRTRVARRISHLPPRLRLTLAAYARSALVGITTLNPTTPGIIPIYVGQVGWAPHILPQPHTPIPALFVMLASGTLVDPGLFHLYPAGHLFLRDGHPAISTIATIRTSRVPTIQPFRLAPEQGPEGTWLGLVIAQPTADITAFHRPLIAAIADTLGDTLIYAVLPDSLEMAAWHMIHAHTLRAEWAAANALVPANPRPL